MMRRKPHSLQYKKGKVTTILTNTAIEMRMEDRKLHWWYRAREQGADQLLPNWIYDN